MQVKVKSSPTSFPGFSPTRPRAVGRVGENPGNEVENSHELTQGEIGCVRNLEMLRKPDGSKFHCISVRRFRWETCKMKMEALFRVSAALPLT